MTTKNDGGPAFPFKCQGPTTGPEIYYGMSLRALFAGQALDGLMANPHPQAMALNAEEKSVVARVQADALLAELQKEQG